MSSHLCECIISNLFEIAVLFYVVGNVDFWEFIHKKVEVSARTKEHRFCDNKNEIAFMQLHNFNLLEVTMRIYVVGKIAFT